MVPPLAAHKNLVGKAVLELLITTIFYMFWSMIQELLGQLNFFWVSHTLCFKVINIFFKKSVDNFDIVLKTCSILVLGAVHPKLLHVTSFKACTQLDCRYEKLNSLIHRWYNLVQFKKKMNLNITKIHRGPRTAIVACRRGLWMMQIDTWPWSHTCWDHMVLIGPQVCKWVKFYIFRLSYKLTSLT